MGNPRSYLEDLEIILCPENCTQCPQDVPQIATPLWLLSSFLIPPTWYVELFLRVYLAGPPALLEAPQDLQS